MILTVVFPRTRPIRPEYVRISVWPGPTIWKRTHPIAQSQALLSVSSAAAVIYHWQPMRCVNE